MKETTLTYRSQNQKDLLTATLLWPEQEPLLVVQILHGMVEHLGRYRRFAEYLTSLGALVVGVHYPGHGPDVPEEKRGYFGEESSWQLLCDDVATLALRIQDTYPHLPYILFGHSMGSFVARTIHQKGALRFEGLILSGTGQIPSLAVCAGKLVGKIEKARLKTKAAESKLLASLAMGSYNKAFSSDPQGHDWISSLPEEVARYDADPACGYPAKLGLFLDLFDGLSYIQSPQNRRLFDKEIPILLLSGAQDPVGHFGKGVRAAYRSYCRAGCYDTRMLLYENCRHEILNDACRDEVYADITAWLREHQFLPTVGEIRDATE